jgi:transposase InsO family protein
MYSAISEEIRQKPGEGSVQRLCQISGVSRAGYYRWPGKKKPDQSEEMELRHAIQAIALEMPAYGYPRMTYELQHRGWKVNHKRVHRLMGEDNLLCLRKKKWVRTTDSNHALPIYPNLAPEMVLTGMDQLWVADITYIRLQSEFVYLAVVLDAFSRRVVGWNVDRSLETELALGALGQALEQRRPTPGLVHHSDRGVQYASHAYTDLLKQHQVIISMSRKGNPYDNAYAESFMKTLKHEEVHRYEYRDLEEVRQRIEQFIEAVYNHKRLHSALGYFSPVQFEAQLGAAPTEMPA